MFLAVSWFVDGGVFPETVNGGGTTLRARGVRSLPFLMANGVQSVICLGPGSFRCAG